MTTITFDTLKYVKTLKAAGFEESQAEALAEVQREVLSTNLEELATKRDLRELKLEMVAEIAPLKWGITVCVAGIMTLLLKSFFYIDRQTNNNSIQPITTEQRTALTKLVVQVASREGKSRRYVWEDVKRDLGVRRINDIRKGDVLRVRDRLTGRATH